MIFGIGLTGDRFYLKGASAMLIALRSVQVEIKDNRLFICDNQVVVASWNN